MKSTSTAPLDSMTIEEGTLRLNACEDAGMSDVVKLWRLLVKLSPLYALTHPLKKQVSFAQGVVRIALAAVLCFGGAMTPAVASDFTLPPDQYVASPTITLEQASQTSTSTTSTTSVSTTSTDAFYAWGPLSTATSTDTASPPATTATDTPSYYVSATGSDTADGSAANPWNSISYAVSKLKAGDTLHIKEGTYHVTSGANFSVSGTSEAYITIQGDGNVVIDGTNLNAYTPVFDTKGQDYIRFNNLAVNHARDAVEVSPGSSYIEIDGLKTDHNHFAVKINSAENVTVRNVYATSSRNAFRVEGANSRNILFENIETYGSKDIYAGYDPNYTNGDGFILETGTNITLRNIISADHWDAGFDIKASNVLVENVVAFGNKNNFKTWGNNITIKSSLSYNAKRQLRPDGTTVDGNGVNVRQGSVKFVNTTFVNNEDDDIKINGGATVQLQNSIIARSLNNGGNILFNEGGTFLEDNNVWYVQGKTAGTAFSGSPVSFAVSPASKFADPKFVDASKYNFRLQSASPAINYGSNSSALSAYDLDGNTRIGNSQVDAGAYEYYSETVTINPVFTGLTAGQVVSGTILVKPDLTVNPDVTSIAYVMDGNAVGTLSVSPFQLGGAQGFDTKTLTNAAHVLSGVMTTSKGSTPFSFNFSVNNNTAPPVSACTTALCGVTAGQTVSGILKVQPNLTLNPDIRKVSYYLNGTSSGKEYAAPFTWGGSAGFDTAKLANGTYTLSGAYTTGTGDKAFSITFTVNNTAPAPTPTPIPTPTPSPSPDPTVCTTAMCGVTAGQTVSGIIKVQPNLTLNPDIRKVSYYLNGTSSGKEYAAPFTWGGSAGFDTAKLANGTYTLSGAYTTGTGDKMFSITFTVNNTAPAPIPSPTPTVCTTAMCGVSNSQVVSGTIKVQPNLLLNPDIRKVAYYLNGTLYERNYTYPYIWGGAGGIDTTKLANGTYTLSGSYTTATGDVNFTITFTVMN